jgi:hypothetical protein
VTASDTSSEDRACTQIGCNTGAGATDNFAIPNLSFAMPILPSVVYNGHTWRSDETGQCFAGTGLRGQHGISACAFSDCMNGHAANGLPAARTQRTEAMSHVNPFRVLVPMYNIT